MDYGVEKDIFIKKLETKNGDLSDVLIQYRLHIVFKFTVFDEASALINKKWVYRITGKR